MHQPHPPSISSNVNDLGSVDDRPSAPEQDVYGDRLDGGVGITDGKRF